MAYNNNLAPKGDIYAYPPSDITVGYTILSTLSAHPVRNEMNFSHPHSLGCLGGFIMGDNIFPVNEKLTLKPLFYREWEEYNT